MMPIPHLADIDIEVLTVLVFLLVSFATWLKEKISRSTKKEEPETSAAQDALREIIWRRQMGEESLPMPWDAEVEEPPPLPTSPEAPARTTPPPVPRGGRGPSRPPLTPILGRGTRTTAPATPPPIPTATTAAPTGPSAIQAAMEAPRPEVSEEQVELARAFEQTTRAGSRRGGRRNALTTILRRPGSVRQAILLSEILGPPVALRHEAAPNP